jgi:tRNA(Ile)-lysidine synthase
MKSPVGLRPIDRRDAGVARVARVWRARCQGEPVLAACSGGADSSALVLALASAGAEVLVAHVVHDLRPPEQALADRDRVRALARGLGLAMVEGEAPVQGPGGPARSDGSGGGVDGASGGGNLEALARRARYGLLARWARERGLRWVMTGHQGQDQLETLLMRAMRGAGAEGLRGIRSVRRIDGVEPRVMLVRPMLSMPAEESRRLCRAAGWAWAEDASNADQRLLRNRVRAEVVPAVLAVWPGAVERAAEIAERFEDLSGFVRARRDGTLARAQRARGDGWIELDRAVLARQRRVVAGSVLRWAFVELGGRPDRLAERGVLGVVELVRSGPGGSAEWSGVRVRVEGEVVRLSRLA